MQTTPPIRHSARPNSPVAPVSNRYVPRISECTYKTMPVWTSLLFLLLLAAGGMSGGNCIINALPGFVPGGVTGGPKILTQDHTLGDANAKVTVVEYGDFECGFCGAFARNEFPTLKTTYVDTGKVRWVFRHFPLSQHARARPAAIAAECADDQGMFFEYHDLIFANQSDLSDTMLQAHADTLGLDRTAFDACLAGTSKDNRIDEDVTSGGILGVTSTPTFFVNDERILGFMTAAQLGEIIDRKLNALGGG